MIIGRLPFYNLWKSKGSFFLKKRRFRKIMKLVEFPEERKIRVLEVGCANGKDFIQFADNSRFEIWGVDIEDCAEIRGKIHFVRADAESLPFEDGYFDLVVTIGLLEHIEPMEKLCKVVSELERVGNHQISVVPSVTTLIEPHNFKLLFPLRMQRKMCAKQRGIPLHLNFFSEHTWTKFMGFSECRIKRFFYLPFFVRNTVIYK